MKHSASLFAVLFCAPLHAGIFLKHTASTCGSLLFVQGIHSRSFNATMDDLEEGYFFHTFLISKGGRTEPLVIASPKHPGSRLIGLRADDATRIETVARSPNLKNIAIAVENHPILTSGGIFAVGGATGAYFCGGYIPAGALLGAGAGVAVGVGSVALKALCSIPLELLAAFLGDGSPKPSSGYAPLDSKDANKDLSLVHMPAAFGRVLESKLNSKSRGVLLFESAVPVDQPEMALIFQQLESLGYSVEHFELQSLEKLVNPLLNPNTLQPREPTNTRVFVSGRPLKRDGATLAVRRFDRDEIRHTVLASSVLGGKDASESSLLMIHPRFSEEMYLLSIPVVDRSGAVLDDSMVVGLGIKRSAGYFLVFNSVIPRESQQALSEQFSYVLSGDRQSASAPPGRAIVLDQTAADTLESSISNIPMAFFRRLEGLGLLRSLNTLREGGEVFLNSLEVRLKD